MKAFWSRFARWCNRHTKSIIAFFMIWLVYGAMIDASETRVYALAQAIAESIVERGTFTLGGSKIPDFNTSLDSFPVNGKLLPAKQPGVFVAAALAYTPLRAIGITYEKHRDFVSAWTSWWTSALAMAVCVVLFYHFARGTGATRPEAGTAALMLAFGNNLFPYTGTPHHDVLATVSFSCR